jgi:hypothetical protein
VAGAIRFGEQASRCPAGTPLQGQQARPRHKRREYFERDRPERPILEHPMPWEAGDAIHAADHDASADSIS